MKVAQISKPGADFEVVEREIPVPGAGQVRIKVQACGVCHSDVFTKEGQWPGIQYPRVPGHEVVGIIDDVGVGVTGWNKGQRVGVGWHGGHDGTCLECRRGDFRNCRNRKFPASAMTVDTSSTWWRRSRHWWRCRTVSAPRRPRRCFARESPPSERCAVAVRVPATSSP
jgi:D-arabinose 1-dehydrogenase-like Zn-dependent alcohol dehydrogenase